MELSKADEQIILTEILDIKKDILKMIYKAQSGHPGGSFHVGFSRLILIILL